MVKPLTIGLREEEPMTTVPAPTEAARPAAPVVWKYTLAAVVAGAVINVVIFVIAKAAGVALTVPDPNNAAVTMELNAVSAIISSVGPLLIGAIVASLTVPRFSWALPALQVIGGALAVLTVAGPLGANTDTGTKVVLSLWHLVLGVVYVAALWQARKEAV
jgi:hypothetical protein